MQPMRYSPPASHVPNLGRHGFVINSLNANPAFFGTDVSDRDAVKLGQVLPPIGREVQVFTCPKRALAFAAIDTAGHDARVIN